MGRLGGLNGCLTVMVLCIIMLGRSEAQDLSNCTSVISDLSSCLNYVLGTEASPPSSCCSNLRTAVNSSATCVCAIVEYGLNNSLTGQFSSVNFTLVEDLPSLCSINASLSDCGISLNTTTSPPSSTPSGSSPPSGDSSDAGALFLGSNFGIWKIAFPVVISAMVLFVFSPDITDLLDTS